MTTGNSCTVLANVKMRSPEDIRSFCEPLEEVIRGSEQVKDPLELQEITLEMDPLVRILGCTGAMLGQVLCAVIPNGSIIFSCKIPNPCGHDRPSGTMTLILAAHTPN